MGCEQQHARMTTQCKTTRVTARMIARGLARVHIHEHLVQIIDKGLIQTRFLSKDVLKEVGVWGLQKKWNTHLFSSWFGCWWMDLAKFA